MDSDTGLLFKAHMKHWTHSYWASNLLGISSILFVQSPMTRSASGGSLHRHGNRNFQHSFRQQYFCAFTGCRTMK
uniref:Uncharacterized protein n=1 Tax=Solanum tuberosum TaxID=4113 RepID=M0ZX12_SOLTU